MSGLQSSEIVSNQLKTLSTRDLWIYIRRASPAARRVFIFKVVFTVLNVPWHSFVSGYSWRIHETSIIIHASERLNGHNSRDWFYLALHRLVNHWTLTSPINSQIQGGTAGTKTAWRSRWRSSKRCLKAAEYFRHCLDVQYFIYPPWTFLFGIWMYKKSEERFSLFGGIYNMGRMYRIPTRCDNSFQ